MQLIWRYFFISGYRRCKEPDTRGQCTPRWLGALDPSQKLAACEEHPCQVCQGSVKEPRSPAGEESLELTKQMCDGDVPQWRRPLQWIQCTGGRMNTAMTSRFVRSAIYCRVTGTVGKLLRCGNNNLQNLSAYCKRLISQCIYLWLIVWCRRVRPIF